MRSTTIRVILAGLSLLACATAWGRSAHFNPATMMSTSEIRRGMTGIGKSVFSGVEIEEFDIEVPDGALIVNLGDLEVRFDDGAEVTPETLREKNLAKGRYDVLKVLASGELTKKLRISAHKFSRQAVEKIEKAGGEAVVLPGKAPVVKNKQKSK